jgi:hypothetical protein
LEFSEKTAKPANPVNIGSRPAASAAAAGSPAKFGNGMINFPETTEQRSERELRKLLLLALYDVRRNNPHNPEISVLVLSELIGVPLSELEFSKWYLKEKKFIRVNESADFCITIDGVDYVETELLTEEAKQPTLYLPAGNRPVK